MRKFERFFRDLPLFGTIAVCDLDFDLDLVASITQFIALAFEGFALNLVK
ncbi:MAG: hypothetical protein ACE37H_04770 [Phycisphaeraceae bacterium]